MVSTDGSRLQLPQHHFPIMAPPRSISLPDFISLNRVFPLVSNDKEAFLKGTPHKTWVATLDEFERRDESTRSALLDAFAQGPEATMSAWRSLMKDVSRQSTLVYVASGSDVTANVYSDDEEGRTSKKLGRLSWSLGEAVLCTAQLSDYLGRGGSPSKSITERLDRRSNLIRVSIEAAVERRQGSLKLWRFVIHHEQLSLREDEVQSTSRLQLQTQAEAGGDVDPEALGTLVEYERMFSAALGELSQKWSRMMPAFVDEVQSVREFYEAFHDTLKQLNALHIDELQFWESAKSSTSGTSGTRTGSSKKKVSALFKTLKSKCWAA
jgi:hypothetical protein